MAHLPFILALLFTPLLALAEPGTAPAQTPDPGTIQLSVDATDLRHRIVQVHERLPASPGPLKLHYPQWIPGNHSPSGPITQLAGLRIATDDGRALAWRRDRLDVYAFTVQVPEGAQALTLDFQFLSPTDPAQGRVVVTPEIVGLQWHTVLLYPAGAAANALRVQARLRLPEGWQFGTALDIAGQDGATTTFAPVSLETLVDSPVYAGKYFRRFDLAPGAAIPVRLDVVADNAQALEAKPVIIDRLRALVAQAPRLYGSRHYGHYDFLLALSSRFSGIGLEHHQSSENGVATDFLTDEKSTVDRDLLAHEYTHSWNGKFRRGIDLATANYNLPVRNDLLWVYEGQTEYWGYVLAARTGLLSPEQSRDALAAVAAAYDHREGRAWRDLDDTTLTPVLTHHGQVPFGWDSWQRGLDYYSESQLIWLDVDTRIRELSGERKSLDDFAHAFFGVEDGRMTPLTYSFDDVAAALARVQPYDWAAYLHARLESLGPAAPLDGLARSGWKLVYSDKPNAVADAIDSDLLDFSYSLGLSVSAKTLVLADVLWNSPAFKAGLASGMTLVAVDGIAASKDALRQAVIAAQKSHQPIVLLVNSLDHIDSVRVEYSDGLRYPHLERIAGTPDRLARIMAPRR